MLTKKFAALTWAPMTGFPSWSVILPLIVAAGPGSVRTRPAMFCVVTSMSVPDETWVSFGQIRDSSPLSADARSK